MQPTPINQIRSMVNNEQQRQLPQIPQLHAGVSDHPGDGHCDTFRRRPSSVTIGNIDSHSSTTRCSGEQGWPFEQFEQSEQQPES
jgi:hypothetical protein